MKYPLWIKRIDINLQTFPGSKYHPTATSHTDLLPRYACTRTEIHLQNRSMAGCAEELVHPRVDHTQHQWRKFPFH